MSLRDDFLTRASTFDRVPSKSGIGFIRPMSKGVKSRMETLSVKASNANGSLTPKDVSDLRWVALVWCLVDETGEPLLAADDRPGFDSWDDSFIEPLFDECLEVSNVTDSDREAFEGN